MKRNLFLTKQAKVFMLFLIFLPCCYIETYAADYFDRLEMTFSIQSNANSVGSGARAMGMGGAFIAIADDATAASWNPAGLINLQVPEVSIVGTFLNRAENTSFGRYPESNGNQTLSDNSLNYLSAVYPFNFWGRNMVVSLNYQNLYDFNRKWNFLIKQDRQDSLADYQQNGYLSALGLAYCVQVTPRFSFGFTLNIWDSDLTPNKWEQEMTISEKGNFSGYEYESMYKSTDRYSFKGINANFGVLWCPIEKLTVGAVWKTPFCADLRHENLWSSSVYFPDMPKGYSPTISDFSSEDNTLKMPMSFGVGIAYKFSDIFIGSFDISRIELNDFIFIDSYQGRESSPITGKASDESNIKPVYKVRLGAEYFFLTSQYEIPLRCGVFYDPAPAEGSPDTIWGVSIGSGTSYKIGERRIIFDIAYQYRWGNNIGDSILKNMNFSQDLNEHTVYSSLIFRF